MDYIDSPYEDEIYLKYLSWEFRNLDFRNVLKAKSIRGDDIVFKRWARDIDKSIIDEVKNSTNFKDLNLRELHVKNRVTSKMPYNYFVYCLATIYDNSHISHSSISEYDNPFKIFVSRIEAFKKDKKILYFPTYRRIEEEIFASNDITDLPFREEIKENLINFGMEDVKNRLIIFYMV